MAVKVQIDEMRPDDWEVIRAIYLEGLSTGIATFETAAPDWQEWSAAHLPICRLVIREEGKVLGWAALAPVSKRQVYRGVAEVSIYLVSSARGRGLGKALLTELKETAERAGFWTLQATIFAENRASQELHRTCGFRMVGYRERIAQRDGIWHDTVLMEWRSRNTG